MSRKGKFIIVAAGVILIGSAAAIGVTLGMQRNQRRMTVAASVNGEVIYGHELENEVTAIARQYSIDLSSAEGAKQRAEISRIVLDQMIDQRLVLQEARKRNVLATNAQVDEQVATIKQNFSSEGEFQSELSKRNLTLADLRERLRTNITVRNLMTAAVAVTVTDGEMEQYFREHRSEFDRPEQVRVKHILLQDEAEARLVLARLRRGEKFEDLARQYSKDPASKDQGGDLGFISRGQVVPEFEQVAFALQPRQASDIVKTQFGYHLIQLVERRAAQSANLSEVRDQIRAQLLGRKQEAAFQAWLKQVKGQAKITRTDQKTK